MAWMEQYKSFNWAGDPSAYVVPDPLYQFAADNPYAQHDDALKEAMRLFEAGNLSEAILAFQAAMATNAENPECWRLLGQCHAENEEERQAIAALLKAVELDPYNLEALLLLSVSYTNDLEQMRALNFLKSWLQHHPDYERLSQDEDVRAFEELYGGGTDTGSQHQMVTHLFLKASQV
jgi:Flp pilus assembly protein TadD